jgi:peptidoglycan/LPS O-acetylase OafA/YrhL
MKRMRNATRSDHGRLIAGQNRIVPMTDQNRLYGADFLRAMACLAVLMHHLAFRMNIGEAPEMVQPLLQFFVMGSFGVSVFFVLSGFLLARPFWLALDRGEAMPSLKVYTMRRLARIIPGFWLALTASLLLDLALGGKVLDAERLMRFVAGLLLVSDWHWVTLFPVDNNGPLWSIGFEVTAYLLLPLCLAVLFAVRSGGWTARLLWLGVIGLVLCAHAGVVAFLPIDEVERGWDHGLTGGAKAWVPRYNPIGFFAIFAIGALAAGVQVMIRNKHVLFDIIGVAAVIGAGAVMAWGIGGQTEGFGWLDIPYGFPLMPLAVGVALVALPASKVAGRVLDNPPAVFIARISFGIYIWHFLIMWLAPHVVPEAFQTSGAEGWSNWLWTSAGVIAVTLVVATASFYLLEQPVVNWARSLEKRGGFRMKPAQASS